ncbi:MAG: glycosyltransferase family 39 protein [Candidatus Omnitrophica bacterium]|nr:glycosyltransferase family 39 protein [Candidatus Omnitrophota bacterium]
MDDWLEKGSRMSRLSTKPTRLPAFFCAAVFLLLLLPCAQAAPSPYLAGEFPAASGIVLLNAQWRIQAFFPTPGVPSDLAILPNQTQFAVVTQQGEFVIYSGEGGQVYRAVFEPLDDVDSPLDGSNRFLLTSREGKRVFFFDTASMEQQDISYTFEGPTDADVLPNGNLLVCDSSAGRIVEITQSGRLVWSYDHDLKQPADAVRLSSGETLISDFDNHRLLVVTPAGAVSAELRGFDHPSKLTLLSDGAVLVADSDQQEIEKISPTGEQQALRKNLNCVRSAAFLPSQNLYLCAVQNKFSPPPNQISAAAAKETKPKPDSDSMGRLFIWLIIAAGLAFFTRYSKQYPRLALLAFIGALLILLSVLYFTQTKAAGSLSHRPSWIFWAAALLLCLLSFRDAVSSYWSKERWLESKSDWIYPLRRKDYVIFLLLPILSLIAQYYHLNAAPFGWRIPWFIPVLLWGGTLYAFYSALTKTRKRGNREHSAFHVGSVTLAVPFTTGSVSLEESDDAVEGATESELEHHLIDPWANTIFILLLFAGAALYLFGVTSVPTDVHGDEAEVALYGIQVRDSGNWNPFNLGWYEIPNLFYLLPSWGMWLFGDNLFGVRAAGALIGVACIPLFYLLARRMLRPAPAVMAACLFTTSTFLIHFSRIGIGYNQTILLTLAVMYGFVRGIQDQDARWLSFAGFLTAIGFLSYQASKILAPLIVLSLGLLWMTRLLSWRGFLKTSVAFFLAFWIGISPMIGVYMTDFQAAFSRAKGVTLLSPEGEELFRRGHPENLSNGSLIWIQLERSLLAPISYHDNSPYLENQGNGGMLDAFPAIFFAAGIFLLLGTISHPLSRLLLLWILCIPIVGGALTDHAPSYQRLVGLLPFLLIAAAPILNGCLVRLSRLFSWMPPTRLHVTTAVLIVLSIFSMHRYFHQIMSKPQHLDEWTRVARYLKDAGPAQYTYFLGPPHVYFQYGTLRFLAPNAKGENVLHPEQFVKNRIVRRGPTCFLLIRSNRQYIDELRRLYPGGREETHFNQEEKAPFTTYVVNF